MKTWDVVLLRYPFGDGGMGTKIRPALVVSKNAYHDTGQDGLFILMTSNVERQAEHDILIAQNHPEFRQTGLLKDTAIRVDKISNLSKSLVGRRLGALGPTLQAAVKQKLGELWDI